jgi:hypothetical protein
VIFFWETAKYKHSLDEPEEKTQKFLDTAENEPIQFW